MRDFHRQYRSALRTRRQMIKRILTLIATTLLSLAWISASPMRASAEEVIMSSLPDPMPHVLIEEVAWAGSSASLADEWIELANIGDATATIGGWSLRGAGEGNRTIFLPSDAEIRPGGTYLIANYPERDSRSAVSSTIAVATTTISLSNAALGIELRDAAGMTMDRAGNGGAPFAGTSGSTFASMIRASSTAIGDAAEGWTTATTSHGFKEGVLDAGTPGFCDTCTIASNDLMSHEDPETVVDDILSPQDDPNDPLCRETTGTADASETICHESDAEADLIDDVATSTISETTSTDTVLDSTTSTDDIVNDEATSTPSETDVDPPPPLTVALNEIVSNPDSGDEWIELTLPLSATGTDRTLLLYDGQGKITTIPTGTPVTASGFLVITLPSPKLNNSGDEVSLRDPTGAILERVVFGALAKGTSWAKDVSDADDVWRTTTALTLGAPNFFPIPIPVTVTPITSPAVIIITPPTTTVATTTTKKGTSTKTTTPKKSTPSKISATTTLQIPTTTSTKKTVTKKTTASTTATKSLATAPAKKTTSKTTAAKPIIPLSFDAMFDNPSDSIRARITGITGSVAKLFGSTNAFVLLSEDGRGLIVYLPKHLHVPQLGSTVRLTGTLKVTAKGPELHMGTHDVWISLATSTPPVTRDVDFLALAEEDGWSLTTVEGVVRTINLTSFAIDADDGTPIIINTPAIIGFRTKRLAKGDRIRAIGFADPRKATPTLLARNGEEITILDHAKGTVTPPASASATTTGGQVPGWAPFGAAGGAIVATGAGKRLKEILQKKKLKMIAGQSS